MPSTDPIATHPLTDRIAALVAVLRPGDAPSTPGAALEAVVADARRQLDPATVWLLLAGLSTVFPTDAEVRAALRALELNPARSATLWLLDAALAAALQSGTPDRPIRIVEGQVVVDVDFAARNNVHTGIQRVVRSVLPLWHRDHEIIATAWTLAHGALRTLGPAETARVLDWGESRTGGAAAALAEEDDAVVVVPWRSVVVVPEVPVREVCARLAALAEHSGSAVVAVGYDCIPVVSADMVPLVEPNRFVSYLTAVKHMRRVAGISVSATAEFRGFAEMLAAQGLPGPEVVECRLPSPGLADVPRPPAAPAAPATRVEPARPTVLCVGSLEPRKNQEGVLFAAQVLWREGLDFELRFVGGGGLGRRLPALVRRLSRAGHPVGISIGISDLELDALYAAARFTVFPSLHEGYGLPVVESLARGVPVVTTDYGSTREIGIDGGAVLVNPRDDDELITAMRRLLIDDAEIARLRQEIARRPGRTWDKYSQELWDQLVAVEPAVAR